MVYCTRCGTKNEDDAKVCSKCGASLHPFRQGRERRKHDDECFGAEEECFGIPRGGTVVGLAIGIIVLLAGLIWFLQQANWIQSTIDVWPFAIIIFGILIVMGALYGMRRKY